MKGYKGIRRVIAASSFHKLAFEGRIQGNCYKGNKVEKVFIFKRGSSL